MIMPHAPRSYLIMYYYYGTHPHSHSTGPIYPEHRSGFGLFLSRGSCGLSTCIRTKKFTLYRVVRSSIGGGRGATKCRRDAHRQFSISTFRKNLRSRNNVTRYSFLSYALRSSVPFSMFTEVKLALRKRRTRDSDLSPVTSFYRVDSFHFLILFNVYIVHTWTKRCIYKVTR